MYIIKYKQKRNTNYIYNWFFSLPGGSCSPTLHLIGVGSERSLSKPNQLPGDSRLRCQIGKTEDQKGIWSNLFI